MISNAVNALKSGVEPKANLNSSKDTPKGVSAPGAAAPAAQDGGNQVDNWAPDWNYQSNTTTYSSHSESLYLKYTSRDGDVLELQSQSTEESYSSEIVRFSATARALAAGNTDAAADGKDVSAAEEDPKAKQLADLRAWAKQVMRELSEQQHKLLEQTLKQSGRHVESGDGKFLMVFMATSQDGAEKAGSADEPQVPAYWNAENTSDRIVHFATQMAEISGLDLDTFAEQIKKAVGAGFDQAHEATGDLPGAAGKLNRDTRELVFSKLSKWLEDRKSLLYNQGAQSKAIITAEVPDGTENNQQ